MKRLVPMLVLSAVAVIAASADAPRFMLPWQSTNPDGLIAVPAIATGFFMDVVGIGLIGGASGAIAADMPGVSLVLTSSGCLLLGGGSALMGLGTERRHQGLVKLGYAIEAPSRKLSRTLAWVALGCTAAAVGVSVTVGDSLAGGITAIVIGAVGAGVEIANLYGPRRSWLNDMNASIDGKAPAGGAAQSRALHRAAPAVVPVFSLRGASGTRATVSYVGLAVGW
jgi:hypothetical protein